MESLQKPSTTLTYNREFLINLKHTGNASNEIADVLKAFFLTKGSVLLNTPKKTPAKTPSKTPNKVYVLKTPAKEGTDSTPHQTPTKLSPTRPLRTPTKVPATTSAKVPTTPARVPLSVVKGSRTPARTPAPVAPHKENVEVASAANKKVAAPVGPLSKLALVPTPKTASVKSKTPSKQTTTPSATSLHSDSLPSASLPSASLPSDSLPSSSAPSKKKTPERESDEHRLEQRQKQIDYGKKTVGYERFTALVPKEKREPGHPVTPRKNQKCSKRSWDGQVRKWRRELHKWDPEDPAELAEWTRIVKEKYGEIQEEDYHLPSHSQLLMSESQPVNRTLVF
eukprot:TRINITY_DN2375_c0_g3_i1.p1 TRINITY_DN2375_c0_g3~~TRINITY_DN2375_c0_g3_i1.p1  ORF type:complete len:339 (-),score=89.52 TRINITY_DN2375_c0_g3_i1:300-1316(-)